MNFESIKSILDENDDFVSQYYLSLLNDDFFVGHLDNILEMPSSVQYISQALVDKGYNLKDCINCLSMAKDRPIIVNGKKMWALKYNPFFNYISKNLIDNLDGYFFDIKYTDSDSLEERNHTCITLSSNIINCFDVIQKFSLDNECDFDMIDGVYIIKSLTSISYCSYSIDETTEDYNSLLIIGNEEVVEEFFEHLRSYCESIYEFININNFKLILKKSSESLPDVFKYSKIEKFGNDDVNLLCDNYSLYELRDFEHIDFSMSNIFLLENLVDLLSSKTYCHPLYLLLSEIKQLHERETDVLLSRYFGEKKETLENIGARFERTRERIRQIETKGIKKLRLRKNKWEILYNLFFVVSNNYHFITYEEIAKFNLSKGVMTFLEDISDLFEWNADLELLVFSKCSDTIKRCVSYIHNNLPKSITLEDLFLYVNKVKAASEAFDILTAEEIELLIRKIYIQYGQLLVKNRMSKADAISYILDRFFPDGIQLYNDDTINQIRDLSKSLFDGFELADNNRSLQMRIQASCIPIGRGMWKLNKNDIIIPEDLKRNIEKYIDNSKISVIPVLAIFSEFKYELQLLGIDNRYYLQGQLKFLTGKYTVSRDYVFKDNEFNFYDLVEKYVKDSKKLITKQDIMKEFPGITEPTIAMIAQATGVMNMNGYFVHIDNLELTPQNIDDLKSAIDNIITDDKIYHAKTIYVSCKENLSGLFARIGLDHYLQFYYLIHELFAGDYEFNRPYIAKLGIDILNGEEQLIKKIISKNITTRDEIRDYTKQIGTFIDRYIDFVDNNNDKFIFLNGNAVVTLDYLNLNANLFVELDDLIDDFIGNNSYRALNEFIDFYRLPKLKENWSEWMLYSIIKKYSKKYKTAASSNVFADAIPVVVNKSFDCSKIDFSEMVKTDSLLSDDILDILDYDDLI